jgi:hypothetical protein
MSAAITAAVVGGAVSAYGAKKAGDAAGGSAPAPVDIFKENKKAGTNLAGRQATGLLDYYGQNIPGFLALQDRFGPQLMGQMFGQTGQFLGGVNGQPGFQGLQLSTSQQAGKTLEQLRAEELGQMTGQAGMTRGLMQALSPEQAAAVQASAQEAERARASAQGVTPEERRGYEQQAREAFQASGRLGGNLGIVSEAMGREDVMARKRAEAAQAGQRSYSQAGEFYTNPGLQALRTAPLSYGAGQQDLRTALTLGPEAAGGFDFNMPLNLAQQQAGAQNQANQANYQINAANQQAKAQMWSSIGSGISGLGGSIGGNFAAPGSMTAGNMGTYAGTFGRSMTGQPLRAYTV